jgi:hypothetical protein
LAPHVHHRRTFLGASIALGVDLWVREGRTQTIEVPVRLQAELLSKVIAYDRNFAERARGRAKVLIAIKPGDAESERVGEQIRAELSALKELGGLPHMQEITAFSHPRALAELCASRAASVLYLSVGLLDEMSGIAGALDGASILTVAVAPAYVPRRAVLGFDAESGRPKLVVHLDQARRQKIAFKPEVLKLARIVT